MKKTILITSFVLIGSSASLLSGCIVGIVGNAGQSVSVQTTPAGAACSLTNNYGTWYINNTPGSVTVQRSGKGLIVSCRKNGFQNTTLNVRALVKTVAVGNVFGVFGGMGVSPAPYNYPTNIQVSMKK